MGVIKSQMDSLGDLFEENDKNEIEDAKIDKFEVL